MHLQNINSKKAKGKIKKQQLKHKKFMITNK